MSKTSGSVAPKERINIKYVPATGDQQAEIELPLKLLVTGDFKGQPDPLALEARPLIGIGKDNFNEVLAKAEVRLGMTVPALLGNADDDELAVQLRFDSLDDFSPDGVARQVPQMQKLLELRNALVALKGPMGNVPAFRRRLQALMADEQGRLQLAGELAAAQPAERQAQGPAAE